MLPAGALTAPTRLRAGLSSKVNGVLEGQANDGLGQAFDLCGNFNGCFFGTGTDQLRPGPVAEQQANRIDDDRLAGTGFPGQHIEAGPESDLQLLNDGKIFNLDISQHREWLNR